MVAYVIWAISKKQISEFISSLDISKSYGPDGIKPSFFQQTARKISSELHLMFEIIKRLRKISKSWMVAYVIPIHIKRDRKNVENSRTVSLLNIVSKILEKWIYQSLYKHFVKILCKQKHAFDKRK